MCDYNTLCAKLIYKTIKAFVILMTISLLWNCTSKNIYGNKTLLSIMLNVSNNIHQL